MGLEGFVPWPEDFVQRYRREAYWRGEVLGDLLRQPAKESPDRIAVATETQRWSYGQLDEKVNRLAAGLQQLGLRMSDRVVVQIPNIPEFVTLAVALFRIGALPVFALPAHRLSEITYLCECSKACAYVTADIFQGFDYRPMAAEVLRRTGIKHVLIAGECGDFTSLEQLEISGRLQGPSPKPDDVAFFLLSGGTTGFPKLIPRTHDDYAWQLRATAEAIRFDHEGVYLAALPIAHNAALGAPGILGALRTGGKAVLAATPSPDEVFALITTEGATVTTLMPSLLRLWLEIAPLSDVDLSGFLIEVGGARLEPDLAHEVMKKLGCRIMHWFGMAEGPLCHTELGDPPEVVAYTQGKPLCAADEIRIVNEMDQDLPIGETGNLLFRGPATLRGYYAAEQYNATAFTSDGFLRTGDLARLTPENNLIIEGRVKDTINRGGEKVSAEEVESYLLDHPDVRDVAVVAMPDRVMGEKICAFVVTTRPGLGRADLKQFLSERGVAEYKVPDRVELLSALPYTQVGKKNKAALRNILQQPGPAYARTD